MDNLFYKSDNEEQGTNSLEHLKVLDGKILDTVIRIKSLKNENSALSKRVNTLENRLEELENKVAEKDAEIRNISSEKTSVKVQIKELLDELESIEVN